MAHFTSKAEMILLLGSRGTALRLDDQSATSDAIEQALIYSDQTIRYYTDRYYLVTNLYGNAWVKSKATIIALNYLSARRGNKELFGRLAAETIQQLEQLGQGFWIPDALPMATNVPSVRTQKVVATGGPTPLKVDEANSTGGGYPDEDFGPGWAIPFYGY